VTEQAITSNIHAIVFLVQLAYQLHPSPLSSAVLCFLLSAQATEQAIASDSHAIDIFVKLANCLIPSPPFTALLCFLL